MPNTSTKIYTPPSKGGTSAGNNTGKSPTPKPVPPDSGTSYKSGDQKK